MLLRASLHETIARLKAGATVLLCVLAAPVICHAQAQPTARDAPLHLKFKLLDQINADRRAHGLQAVEYSEELSRVADEHCREMLLNDYTSHWNLAGWKPYLRYTQAGIADYTSENIASVWSSHFPRDAEGLLAQMLESHARLMAEKPPDDGHRRSILTPGHRTVGIGVAHNETGMRMIEVFGRREVSLERMDRSATLRSQLEIKGRLLERGTRVFSIAIYYEPLPQPMTRQQLQRTYAYGLPHEEFMERPRLPVGRYADGTTGKIYLDGRKFEVPLRLWRGRPGVYTVAVWVASEGREPLIGGMATVIVER